jgi:hypothetical protein
MSADEVLLRLAEQARGEHGKYLRPDGAVDFNAVIADGKGHLIKGIKETKYGLDIEFYDAQTALVHIGKYHGLFTDKLDVSLHDIDREIERELARLAVSSEGQAPAASSGAS